LRSKLDSRGKGASHLLTPGWGKENWGEDQGVPKLAVRRDGHVLESGRVQIPGNGSSRGGPAKGKSTGLVQRRLENTGFVKNNAANVLGAGVGGASIVQEKERVKKSGQAFMKESRRSLEKQEPGELLQMRSWEKKCFHKGASRSGKTRGP